MGIAGRNDDFEQEIVALIPDLDPQPVTLPDELGIVAQIFAGEQSSFGPGFCRP